LTRNEKKPVLSERQAYRVMLRYLEMQYDRTRSDDLGVLLGSASLLEDGLPADPAMAADWRACVDAVVTDNIAKAAAE
jgi:hypothetical protein